MAEQTEAQRRAAARKAKILARGNTGLQRLAQTARGDDAAKLYGDDFTGSPSTSAPPSRPDTPSTDAEAVKPNVSTKSPASSASPAAPETTSTSTATESAPKTAASKPSWAPRPIPASTAARSARSARAPRATQGRMRDDDFAPPSADEQAQMKAELEAMMSMLGGGAGGGGAGGAGGPPDMNNFLAALLGGAGMDMQDDGFDRALTESPFHGTPGGPRTPGAGGDPFAGNPFAGLAGMGGMPGMQGMGGMPGMPGMPGMVPPGPTKAQRVFPIVHLLSVIAFAIFVAVWWEPTIHAIRLGEKVGMWGIGLPNAVSWATRWGSLAGWTGESSVNSVSNVETLPIFYAFVTLQLILLATRMTVSPSRPNLHPLLANVLPMLPPVAQKLITTGSKYLGVWGQVSSDACVLVFSLGAAIIFAQWIAFRS